MLQRHERRGKGEHHQKPVNPAVESGKEKLKALEKAGYRVDHLTATTTVSGVRFQKFTLKRGQEEVVVNILIEEKKRTAPKARVEEDKGSVGNPYKGKQRKLHGKKYKVKNPPKVSAYQKGENTKKKKNDDTTKKGKK